MLVKGNEMKKVLIQEGIVNIIFPFALKDEWNSPFQENIYSKDVESYRNYIGQFVSKLQKESSRFEWGMSWLPNEAWYYKPYSFTAQYPLNELSNPITFDSIIDEQNRDDIECVSITDQYLFVTDFFRKQPVIRVRLADKCAIYHEDIKKRMIQNIKIDVSYFPGMNHGTFIFRLPIDNIDIDDFIGIRLTQFRRDLPYKWIKNDGYKESFIDLQDLYQHYCRTVMGRSIIPILDVKMYGACVEIFSFKSELGSPLGFDEVMRDYKQQLYGMLCCDESWRFTELHHVDTKLNEMNACTRYKWIQYAQEVTYFLYNALHADAKNVPHAKLGVLGDYNRIRLNTKPRSIALGCNYLELICIQQSFLYSLSMVARNMMGLKSISRGKLISLRKNLIISHLSIKESSNVLTDLKNILVSIRGMDLQLNNVQESIDAIDKILDHYRFYNNELITDLFTALMLAAAIASIVVTANPQSPLIIKLSLLTFIVSLTISRLYKYPKDKLSLSLIIITLITYWIVFLKL